MSSVRQTYVIFGSLSGLQREFLDEEFARQGLVLEPRGYQTNYATALYVSMNTDDRYDRRSYTVRCEVKNLLAIDSMRTITNKKELHLAMRARNPRAYEEHFARTWTVSEFVRESAREFARGGIFILRPSTVGFYSGRGIVRVTNARELSEAIAKYESMRVLDTVIVSEYADHPLLFDGRKFHLRAYLLVRARGGGDVAWELFTMSKILTARDPYVRAQYDDANIHDTHAKSTKGAYFFPDHAARIASSRARTAMSGRGIACVREQMLAISEACVELVRDKLQPYPESARGGFEVFGLDLLVTQRDAKDDDVDNPRLILVELNNRVGYATPADPMFVKFQREYFAWIWKQGYEPLLAREGGRASSGARAPAQFVSTPIAHGFSLQFSDTPIPLAAYKRFAEVCARNVTFGPIESAQLRAFLRESNAESDINLFQADSIRRHLARQYNITNAWRVDKEIDDILHEYQERANVIDIAHAHALSPYVIFKEILARKGVLSAREDALAQDAHKMRARAYDALRELSLGNVRARDVLDERDAEQYESVRDYDFESVAVQMRMAAEADAREAGFVGLLRALGIRLRTQKELYADAMENGGAIVTPDVLFLDTVYVNGARAHWLDFKSYCGTPIPFLARSVAAQAKKYNRAFGPGFIVYEYGFVDFARSFACVSAYAAREIIEKHMRAQTQPATI